ncbi:3 beta-hydroxysteroid dehydrogenase type 7-like [Glandiceps talaboti]
MALDKLTVLVTGGAGFLGQHIIKLLIEKTMVQEIKSFDIGPLKWNPELVIRNSMVQFHHIHGDITNVEHIAKACEGVDAVFHTAAVVDVTLMPDIEKLTEVNVVGTRNVILACIENNVQFLVGTSSHGIFEGEEPIHDGDENLEIPEKFLFVYTETKYMGEKLMLDANNRVCRNGEVLKTVVIRPVAMYGEGDSHAVKTTIQVTQNQGGVFYKIGSGAVQYQMAYIGNVAWLHIKALQKLNELGSLTLNNIAGRVFFATDDTPLQPFSDFMKPFIVARGYRVSKLRIPYWLIYCIYWIMGMFCLLLKPMKRINMNTTTDVLYCTFGAGHSFNSRLAKQLLDYKPIFTPQEAIERSLKYYSNINLDD